MSILQPFDVDNVNELRDVICNGGFVMLGGRPVLPGAIVQVKQTGATTFEYYLADMSIVEVDETDDPDGVSPLLRRLLTVAVRTTAARPLPEPPEAQTFFIIISDDQDVFGPTEVDPYAPVLAAGNADLLISRYDETEPGEFTERGDWIFGEPQLRNLVITGDVNGTSDFLFYAKRVGAGGPLGVVLPFIVLDFDSGHKLYTEKDQGSFYSLVVQQGEEEIFRESNIYIQPQRDMWIEYIGGTLRLINTWNEDETRTVQLTEEIELGAVSHVAIGAHHADAYVGFDEFALYAPIQPII